MPCRINRRRMWTHRIMLECTQWPVNSFWTLTYDDAHLPLTKEGLPTLDPEHLKNFLKRLRKDYQPLTLRYFNVGEYGELGERPHYHLALFNYPFCERGVTRVNRNGDCCSICDRVRRVWGAGLVYSGKVEDASAAYISGYVTKKLTNPGDVRLCGRFPEFARMSLKPGIGAQFMPEVASALLTHNLDSTLNDVPSSLQHGTHVRPLGRYLTRQLRKHVGKDEKAPQSTLDIQKEKLRPMREMAQAIAAPGTFSETFKELIIQSNEGKYQRQLSRSKLYKKRGTL